MTGDKYKTARICRVLGIGRSSAYRESTARPKRYARADDRTVTAQIRSVIRTRASYGARRVTALVNREFEVQYNAKRIRRVMDINGWKLPRSTRRRTGRAHTGLIRRDGSNERWCSDGLEIACWNGEIVQVAFALDCHDREVISHVAVPRDLRGVDIRQLMQAHAQRCRDALWLRYASRCADPVAQRQRQAACIRRWIRSVRRSGSTWYRSRLRQQARSRTEWRSFCEYTSARLHRRS
jgi:hypothetical protein